MKDIIDAFGRLEPPALLVLVILVLVIAGCVMAAMGVA